MKIRIEIDENVTEEEVIIRTASLGAEVEEISRALKEWTVDNQVNATFGEVEEKNRNNSNGSPVLRLVGKCSFAGISIIYV